MMLNQCTISLAIYPTPWMDMVDMTNGSHAQRAHKIQVRFLR